MAYSIEAWVAAHTSLQTIIAAGTGDSIVKIKSASGATLAESTIDGGTVNGVTGVLSYNIVVQEDNATAGVAAYAQLCDGDETPHVELPCQAGFAPVAGYCVMNTLNILGGNLVDILLIEFAPPTGSIIVEE
jgi:hypothetical protein